MCTYVMIMTLTLNIDCRHLAFNGVLVIALLLLHGYSLGATKRGIHE